MNGTLTLQIQRVKCIDETGGWIAEKVGNDEIYMGGFTLDEQFKLVKEEIFSVYADFDDGDEYRFNPPKMFKSFSFNEFNTPKLFAAGMLLVEKDSTGIYSTYSQLLSKVAGLVGEYATRTNLGGVVASGVTSTLLSFLGSLFDRVMPGMISQVWRDEFFPPKMLQVILTGSNHTWNGSNESPIESIDFRAHDGLYRVFYNWKIVHPTNTTVFQNITLPPLVWK